MDLLKEFPALWVIVGGILTGFLFWFLNRNVFTLTQSAQVQLANTYKDQIKALTTDKDYYKTKVQDQTQDLQATRLRVTELESKPDLSKIFETYRGEADRRFHLYQEQSKVLERLVKLLEQLAIRFDRHEELFLKHLAEKPHGS